MSLLKRGKKYHYRFKHQGKLYTGNTHETEKPKAERVEKRIKAEVVLRVNGDNVALNELRQQVLRDKAGASILLNETWDEFRKEAPAKMSRQPSAKKWLFKEGCWNDFKAFLNGEYPSITTLYEVTDESAVAYVTHLKTKGKYDKIVQSSRGRSYKANLKALAPSTVNEYITQLKQLFEVLKKPSGRQDNPFSEVTKEYNKKSVRNVFELEEIKLMFNLIEDDKLWELYSNPSPTLIVDGKKMDGFCVFSVR